jgi:hypothetical protein
MEDVETWLFQAYDKVEGRLKRLGLNFGAPGDWSAPDGTLWLDYPSKGGRGPEVGVEVSGEGIPYRMHTARLTGPAGQVTASGMEGAARYRIALNGETERSHTVRLYFAEPSADKAGERVFDVLLQGKPVLSGFDVFASAGGSRRGLVRAFTGVCAGGALELELRPAGGSRLPPVLSGIEIALDETIRSDFILLAGLRRAPEYARPGALKGTLELANVTDQPLAFDIKAAVGTEVLAAQRVTLAAGAANRLEIGIPVNLLNASNRLDVVTDLGDAFGAYRTFNETFPLEVEVPAEAAVVVESLTSARIQMRNRLTDQDVAFRLIVRAEGSTLLEREMRVKGGGMEEAGCPLPAGLAGKQLKLELVTEWDAAVTPVPGRTAMVLDFQNMKVTPRLKGPMDAEGFPVAWGAPAVELGSADGLFPEAKRAEYAGADDLRVGFNWGWDGTSLYLAARVMDDRHYNTKTGAGVWDADSVQIAIVPAGQSHTIAALGLTEAGAVFHQYAGPDGKLASKSGYRVRRDETSKTTLYEMRLPLGYFGIAPEAGTIFGLNLVVFDDDTGAGHGYWRQMAPGLAGGLKVNLFPRFVLGND